MLSRWRVWRMERRLRRVIRRAARCAEICDCRRPVECVHNRWLTRSGSRR